MGVKRGDGHLHKHYVRGRSPHLREGFPSVLSFTDDLYPCLCIEDNYQADLGKIGVAHNDYSYGLAATHD